MSWTSGQVAKYDSKWWHAMLNLQELLPRTVTQLGVVFSLAIKTTNTFSEVTFSFHYYLRSPSLASPL